jgi:hypothetical protein
MPRIARLRVSAPDGWLVDDAMSALASDNRQDDRHENGPEWKRDGGAFPGLVGRTDAGC